MLDCFVYIRQDATQSYLEVLFYSIGAFNELQECSSYLPALDQAVSVDFFPILKPNVAFLYSILFLCFHRVIMLPY